MPVADLASEWFESEPLRATVAGGGILWIVSRSAVRRQRRRAAAARRRRGASPGGRLVREGRTGCSRGGVGRAPPARPASRFAPARRSPELRSATSRRRVPRCGPARTLTARAVVSGVDPKRTFLGLVDPMHLAPELIRRLQNIRARGTLAKVNYAVSALPRFAALAKRDQREQEAALSGRVRLAPDLDDIERAFDAAKYGAVSGDPWIELAIPSIADSSLAPAGQHVVSAYVQYAPYHLRGRHMGCGERSPGRCRDADHRALRAWF